MMLGLVFFSVVVDDFPTNDDGLVGAMIQSLGRVSVDDILTG